MPSSNSLNLSLGSLRSNMTLTLHTHHASRIWHGRAASERQAAIVGLNGYIAVMNKMKRGREQDDPYSDGWMLRIEDKLDQTKATLHIFTLAQYRPLINGHALWQQVMLNPSTPEIPHSNETHW